MKKLIFLFPALFVLGCAATVTRFEQYSVSMNLKVAADSSITIGDDEKFFGVLWLNPILKSENVPVDHVKLIQNYGSYFICADQFKRVWMVEPEEDGLSGEYKAIDVTPDDKIDAYADVGLSRYGSREKTCVKFKFNKTEVYIDKKGRVHEKCNE
jgi:hypothetical protein